MELNFKLSEFCIDTNADIPQNIADAILKHHILVLQPIRETLKIPIIISQRSGWRSKEWELSKGRSGNSQHTFVSGKGAVDLTVSENKDFTHNMLKLLEQLKDNSPFTRICLYTEKGFVHCDYKSAADDRQYFECGESGKWSFKANL